MEQNGCVRRYQGPGSQSTRWVSGVRGQTEACFRSKAAVSSPLWQHWLLKPNLSHLQLPRGGETGTTHCEKSALMLSVPVGKFAKPEASSCTPKIVPGPSPGRSASMHGHYGWLLGRQLLCSWALQSTQSAAEISGFPPTGQRHARWALHTTCCSVNLGAWAGNTDAKLSNS